MSQSQGEPQVYTLYAVLVHSGFSCHAGHYFCYIKVWSRLQTVLTVKQNNASCHSNIFKLKTEGNMRILLSRYGKNLLCCVCLTGQQRAVVSDERFLCVPHRHRDCSQPAGLCAFLHQVCILIAYCFFCKESISLV